MTGLNELYFNSLRPSDAYILQQTRPQIVHIMDWRQIIIWSNDGLLLSGPLGTSEIWANEIFLQRKRISKCRLQNGGHSVSDSMC